MSKKILSIAVCAVFILSIFSITGVLAESTPEISILSPKEGEKIKTSDLTVGLSVSNFEIVPPQENLTNLAGKGHLHAFLDSGENYIVITSNSHKFERLTNGDHKIKFELHANDHNSYSPSVTKELNFKVEVGGKMPPSENKAAPPLTKMANRKEKLLERLEPYKDRLEKLSNETREKLLNLPPGIAKNIIKSEKLESDLKNWSVKILDKEGLQKAFGKRFIAPEKMKLVEEKLKEAKNKLAKAHSAFKEKKEEFKKNKGLESAKSYLTNLLDALTERVNKIKLKVEDSKDISEEKSSELIKDLDGWLSKISEWRTKAEAAKTKDVLKGVLKEVQGSWADLDHTIKIHGWRVELQHFAGILNQANHLDNKLNKILLFAEKNNVTIRDKDTKLTNFENKLEQAKTSYKMAADDFSKLKSIVQNSSSNSSTAEKAERQQIIDSMKSNLKDSKKSLKEAREALITITREIVNILKDKTLLSDSGKVVKITEESALDPTKIIEGVETNEEGNVEIAQEETIEL